eukprot:1136681-Pelagomonas_calceolata.AAC.11
MVLACWEAATCRLGIRLVWASFPEFSKLSGHTRLLSIWIWRLSEEPLLSANNSSCIHGYNGQAILQKRKDYASQVQMRALRKGPLTSKLARASPSAERNRPSGNSMRRDCSKSRESPSSDSKKEAYVGLVSSGRMRLQGTRVMMSDVVLVAHLVELPDWSCAASYQFFIAHAAQFPML